MKKLTTKVKEVFPTGYHGITLIALVITIIVLLILAGVAIATLTGENGVLTQATNTKEETNKATEEEKIHLAVLGSSITDNGYVEVLETNSFNEELKNQFGKGKFKLEPNSDGSFLITINDTKRKYYINDDKTVINSDNIIEISDTNGLKVIRDNVNKGYNYEEKVIILTNNIDLSGEDWEPIGQYNGNSINDNSNTSFNGIFDGRNFKIEGMKNSSSEKASGLFGIVNNATIRNIGINNSCTLNPTNNFGAIAGFAINGSFISNCYNLANIEENESENNNIGGILGQSINSTILGCYNSGEIINSISSRQGGIVGTATRNSIIKNCYNLKEVSGKFALGGIVRFY